MSLKLLLIQADHLIAAINLHTYLCIMKYQLGDKILVLHSNEEGEVVDIINDKMVLIDVDGVRFPVYMDQIDFPYFKRFSEKNLG